MSGEHDGFIDLDFDGDEPDEAPTVAAADDDEDDVELHGQFFDGLGS